MRFQTAIAQLRFQCYRHGWPAVVGLALLVGAVGLQLLGATEVRARADRLRAEQAELRKRLAQGPDQPQAAGGRLAVFYASLPAAADAAGALETIHRAAAANQVELAHGEYRLARDGGGALLRYQLLLPARTSYPQLRAWLAEVMNEVPAVALDELAFRRDDIGSGAVEAQVRLTLFLRAG